MSGQIRCVYTEAPRFPATDQHPGAVRYLVGQYWVDATGGQPTLAEVEAVLGTDAAGQAESVRRAELDADIANDSTINTLKAMTNTQLDAWFAANVTDLASARAMLRRLFKIVVRRVL